MSTEERPVDLRVRRTRLLLEQAFFNLMNQKSFQAITVQDITTAAMVNRSTFYDHFIDKYALLEYSVSQRFRDQLAGTLPDAGKYSTENLQVLITTMCEFFVHLHDHCRRWNDEQQIALVESQIMKVVKEVLTGWLQDTAGKGPSSPSDGELAVSVASWAMYGAAHYWSEGKREGTITQFAEKVVPIIEGTLKAGGTKPHN